MHLKVTTIMISDEADEVQEKLFNSLESRYQINL